jgi:hypothetical protein
MIADLKFRLQRLAKNPGFAAAVALALGITANRFTSKGACQS